MDYLFTSESIISFFILVLLEVVLGIDNVIFVSIIINRLPNSKEKKARRIWMITGIISRSLLLMGLSWLLAQKGKLAGGLFLIYKTVGEIHHKLEGEDESLQGVNKPKLTLSKAIVQIMLIDIVFSFDSIITAGGTADHVEIMIAAVVIAMFIMFMFSPKISAYIHKHPSLKMLALSFLVMIGLTLVIEGWDAEKAHDLHLKNYVYFGMAFSFLVEILNIVMMKKAKKRRIVELNEPQLEDNEDEENELKETRE
jgi:predicted tellurium resistance membrane protein TerC